MRFHILSVLSVAYAIVAFPGMVADPAAKVHARQLLPSNLPLSSLEGNSGPMPSLSFNPTNQFVNVRSGTTHQFIAPSSTDERRLCPDLNAAANHGFLPLNSIISINQTVTGLNQAYSFGPEFAAALSVIANALTGIQLLGISFSHNEYESDASPACSDAYLNNDDAHSLNLPRFDQPYFSAENYILAILRDPNKVVHDYSINNNPYYFSASFACLVPPIANHFIINPMFNVNFPSSPYIICYLSRDILKSFFSVSGLDNAHIWTPGHEQMPQNWHKRLSSNPYGAMPAFANIAILATKYPDVEREYCEE
ncbi:Cloroperoxidase [Acephala macrosclerotiorum]|nr:Cloroperoxidase [Acephala macrosclerotiorum]